MSQRYHDRLLTTNTENQKNWDDLKFGPNRIGHGKRLQNSELNEIASLFYRYDEAFNRTLLKDGQVLGGCDIEKIDSTSLFITEGFIFVDGQVRKIDDTTAIVIIGTGREYIKVRGTKRLIKDNNALVDMGSEYSYDQLVSDSDLLDPALETEPVYQNPEEWAAADRKGAYREAYVYNWYVDTTQAGTIVYTLDSGEEVPQEGVENRSKLWQDVARRTYEESGNYTLVKPVVRTEERPDTTSSDGTSIVVVDATNFDVMVEAFTGYLKGFRVINGVAQRLQADKARDTWDGTAFIVIDDDLPTSQQCIYQIPRDDGSYIEFIKSITILSPPGFTKGVRKARTAATETLERRCFVQNDILSLIDGIQFSEDVRMGSTQYEELRNYHFITGNRPDDNLYTGTSYACQIGNAGIYWYPGRPQPRAAGTGDTALYTKALMHFHYPETVDGVDDETCLLYHFDAAGNFIADASGNGLHGFTQSNFPYAAPPIGDIHFNFIQDGYAPPPGDAVDFDFVGLDTSEKLFGDASLYMRGSGYDDYIIVPGAPCLQFNDDDFTIDTFVRPQDCTSSEMIIASITFDSTNYWKIYTDCSNGLGFELMSHGVQYNLDSTAALSLNTWHHAAVERYGTNMYLYENGYVVDSISVPIGLDIDFGQDGTDLMYVGYEEGNDSTKWRGWMDEFRISNSPRWKGINFTPTITGYYDTMTWSDLNSPYGHSITLIDTDGLTQPEHSSIHNPFPNADVPDPAWGSVKLQGDVLQLPSHSVLNINGNDFTIEHWLRPSNSTDSDYVLFESTPAVGPALKKESGQWKLIAGGYTDSTSVTDFLVDNNWQHISLNGKWNGSNYDCKLFVDGTDAFGVIAMGSNPMTGPFGLDIGENVEGYLAELRVSIGTGANMPRHWSNFTPRSCPYPVGDTYTVDYDYWAHTTEGDYVAADSYDDYERITVQTDFDTGSTDISLRDVIDFRTDPKTIIDGSDPGPGTWDGTTFVLAVSNYLYRTDTVYINADAEVKIQRGNPSQDLMEAKRMGEDVITIASLQIAPYTYQIPESVRICLFDNVRFTMQDIQKMENRIDKLEYFMTLDLLEEQSFAVDSLALKKGIFTDPFEGSKRADLHYDDGTFSTTVSFDMQDKAIKLPFTVSQQEVNFDQSETTAQLNDQTFTLPFQEEVFVNQFFASRSRSVQPFEVFEWGGELTPIPAHDIFVEIDTIPVHLNADYSVFFGEGEGELDHLLNPFKQGFGSWNTLIGGYYQANTSDSVADPGPPLGIWNISENKVVDLSLSPFIRESEVTVFGEGLRTNIDGLTLTFDGVEMYAHDADPEPTVPGKVKTDANGGFSCKIQIPAGTFRVGERVIRVDNEGVSEGERTYASAKYFAQGTIETRYDTYLSSNGYQIRSQESTDEVFSEKREIQVANQPDTDKLLALDAVAQSFRTDNAETKYLSGIDLYFKSKATNTPITLCIVEMKNGYPSRKVLTQVTLNPSQVNVSDNASVATAFDFPDPLCVYQDMELAFTIYSGSQNYDIFYSVLGERDTLDNLVISKNPYSGVMFTSANQKSWQADGFSDLKFRIRSCNFENECQLVFTDIDSVQAGNIVLNTTQILPDNTDIIWFYSIDGKVTWKRMIPNMDNFLTSVATTVSLRADITGEGVSPMINKERTGFVFVLFDEEGTYVTRQLQLESDASNIKAYIQQSAPSGTTLTLHYKIDDGEWTQMPDPSFELLDRDEGVWEAVFEEDVASFTNIRLAIKLETNNQAVSPSIKNLRVICS